MSPCVRERHAAVATPHVPHGRVVIDSTTIPASANQLTISAVVGSNSVVVVYSMGTPYEEGVTEISRTTCDLPREVVATSPQAACGSRMA